MSHSIGEISHCGIDVHKPEYFTCIVGHKDDPASFVCHVFKCINKETVWRNDLGESSSMVALTLSIFPRL